MVGIQTFASVKDAICTRVGIIKHVSSGPVLCGRWVLSSEGYNLDKVLAVEYDEGDVNSS